MDNKPSIDELRAQEIGQTLNGVPGLVSVLTVEDAHNFIADYQINISTLIQSLETQIKMVKGMIEGLPKKNQAAMIPNIEMPESDRDQCESLEDVLEHLERYKVLNQGGLNFITNINRNGYKIVNSQEAQLLQAMEAAKTQPG